MFNLLIVEDEILDNEGIRDSVQSMNLKIRAIETALSGFEALEKLDSFSPDILLTDINMPGMNGLKLAEKVKNAFPDIEIIFISGHDDFVYLKNAIRLDAFEYILKPIDDDELRETIDKAIEKLIQKRHVEEELQTLQKQVDESKPVMKNKLLLDIVYGTIGHQDVWKKINYFDIEIQDGVYCVLLLEIDDYKLLSEKYQKDFFEQKLLQIMSCADLKKYGNCLKQFMFIDNARCAVILSFDRCISEALRSDTVLNIANELLTCSKKSDFLSITIAIGPAVDELSDIYISYTGCGELISQKMLKGKGTIICNSQYPSIPIDNTDFYRIDKELIRCLTNFDLQRTFHFIDYLFDSIENSGIYHPLYVQNYCINVISHVQLSLIEQNATFEDIFGSGVILWEKLMKFDSILDIRQWVKNIFKSVIEYLENRRATHQNKVVEKVLQYIDEGYKKDITIKEIADKLYYSSNHLGYLFKCETGMGFSEYLNKYRMNKASELLKSTILKTYQIADTIGYANVNSFIKQFKLVYGMTPKEYRGRC